MGGRSSVAAEQSSAVQIAGGCLAAPGRTGKTGRLSLNPAGHEDALRHRGYIPQRRTATQDTIRRVTADTMRRVTADTLCLRAHGSTPGGEDTKPLFSTGRVWLVVCNDVGRRACTQESRCLHIPLNPASLLLLYHCLPGTRTVSTLSPGTSLSGTVALSTA